MTPEQEQKFDKILYVGFGAFGIASGINNGYTTDSMIAIRDKTIQDSKYFISSLLSEERKKVLEEVEDKIEILGECEFDCKDDIKQLINKLKEKK